MVSSTCITRVPSVRPRRTVCSAKSFRAERQKRPKGPRTLESNKRQQSFKRITDQDSESLEVPRPRKTKHTKKRQQSIKRQSGQDLESLAVSKPKSTYKWCVKTKAKPFHPVGSRVLRARSSNSNRVVKKQLKLPCIAHEGSFDGLEDSDSDCTFVDDSSSDSDEEELAPLPLPPPRTTSIRKLHDSRDRGIEDLFGIKEELKPVEENHKSREDDYMTAVSESSTDPAQGESPDYDTPPVRAPCLPPKKSQQAGASKTSVTATNFDENQNNKQPPTLPPKSSRKEQIEAIFDENEGMRTKAPNLPPKKLRDSSDFLAFQTEGTYPLQNDRKIKQSAPNQLSVNDITSGLQSNASIEQAQARSKSQQLPPPPKCTQKEADLPLSDLEEHEDIQLSTKKMQVPFLSPKILKKDEKTFLTILESDESDKDNFVQIHNHAIIQTKQDEDLFQKYHTPIPLPKPCPLSLGRITEDTDTESSSDDVISPDTNMFEQPRFGSCRVRVLPNQIPNLHQLRSVKRDMHIPPKDFSEPRQSVVLKPVLASTVLPKSRLNAKPSSFRSLVDSQTVSNSSDSGLGMSTGSHLRSSRRSFRGRNWNQNEKVKGNSLCIDKHVTEDCDLYLNQTTIIRQETINRYHDSGRPKARRRKSMKGVKDKASPVSLDHVTEVSEVFQKHRTSPLGLGLSFRNSKRHSTLPEIKPEQFGNVTGQNFEEIYKVPKVTISGIQKGRAEEAERQLEQPLKQGQNTSININVTVRELEESDITSSLSEEEQTSGNRLRIKSNPGRCNVRRSQRKVKKEAKGRLAVRTDNTRTLNIRRTPLQEEPKDKTDAMQRCHIKTRPKKARKPSRGRSIEITNKDNELDSSLKSSLRISGISSLGVAPSVPPRDYDTDISREDFQGDSISKSNYNCKTSNDVDYLEPAEVIHLPKKTRTRKHRQGQFSCVVRVIRSCAAISRLYNRLRNICRHRFVR